MQNQDVCLAKRCDGESGFNACVLSSESSRVYNFAAYATLCMLIELQSQCNVIVYRCNTCIAEIIGSRFHCPVCDVSLHIAEIIGSHIGHCVFPDFVCIFLSQVLLVLLD